MSFKAHSPGSKCYAIVAIAVVLTNGCVNSSPQQNSEAELTQTVADQSDTTDRSDNSASLKVDVVVVNAARDSTLLRKVMSEVKNIYQQCRIEFQFATRNTTLATEKTIDSETRSMLAQQYKKALPTIFFVSRTAEADVAFAHLPSLDSPSASTIWITERVNEGCLAWITAHEIGHVLLNNGKHSNGTGNVMSNGCTLSNWNNGAASPVWTTEQCSALHQSPSLK